MIFGHVGGALNSGTPANAGLASSHVGGGAGPDIGRLGGEQDPNLDGPATGDESSISTGEGLATVFCLFGRAQSPSSSELITTGSADVSPPDTLSIPFDFEQLAVEVFEARLGLMSPVDPFDFFD
jgi:hypothetical protein